MVNPELSRKGFLGAVAGAAVLGAAPAAATGRRERGVLYAVGSGETPATDWNRARMRSDLRAIRHGLCATAVGVYGDGVGRLTATAEQAAEEGLAVWLQPRLGDRPHAEILEHLAETGRAAERLRRQGARVRLSVGCEFVLFVPGIVPGDDVLERVDNLLKGNFDPVVMRRRLAAFVKKAAATGRSVFHGPLTYGASADEETDWRLFDLVSVNYYPPTTRRADLARVLRPFRRWGKPVAVTECGTCAYVGAPEQGGMAWDVVDYSGDRPVVRADIVRSEPTQADYLTSLLRALETLDLHTILVYEFSAPDNPYHPTPRHDLDKVSYSLVKTLRDHPDTPTSPWHWTPKLSYHAVATHFGAHG